MFKPVEANQNFIEMEKKWLKVWYEKGLIKKYLLKNKDSKKTFSFLDGPITANNPMGVHHAWGRTYKDLWQRFHNLMGDRQRFQNGFDCQGLWVEVEVEKELKLKNKRDIENLVPGDTKASVAKFVQLCKDRVMKYSKIQTDQSKRLGYFMDWDHSYYTMSDENNYMIWHFLKVCYDNGWIYKGHETVPWCPRCQTAISQHEMLTEDYREVIHEAVFLELPVENRKDEYLLVWTTTPWTIPANIAVAIDEKLDYSLVKGTTGDNFWVVKDLVDKVFKGQYEKIVKTVKGKEIVGLHYTTPFDDLEAVKQVAKANPQKFHVVVPTDEKILPISTEEGTGLVHTAISAGVEDFKLGQKLGLPMIPVIDDSATYLPGLGFLSGQNAKKNPRIILDYLNEKNSVFEIHNYRHRYPACWRCKAELVWKVADEWYISMDVKSKAQNLKPKNLTLRERMIDVAKKIKWIPGFGLDRELDWLKNMHDWLISKKNRYWGLALPIYECPKCKSFEVIGSKEELKKRAVSGWDQFEGHSPHKPFIDEVSIKCRKCGEEIKRIEDVGNPWLDAGIVPYSTIAKDNQGEPLYFKNKEEWKQWFPVDFITESFPGQFKNWFYAMIAMSTVLEDINPYKTVLGYGTLTGEDGRPMHKSWGNMIEFNEGADKIGVDVMRWMYCRHNPEENLLFGYKRADEVRRQFYLMLWNVYKFFVEYANLDNVKCESSSVKSANILDEWIWNRMVFVANCVKENLLKYDAQAGALEIEKFVSDVSTWYIRRSRDRVWSNSNNSEDKKSFYSTLYGVLTNLSIVLSPFLPFISEEIFTNLTGKESVNLEAWPDMEKTKVNAGLIQDMVLVREIAEVGHRKRKESGIKVRQPLAQAKAFLPEGRKFNVGENLEKYSDLLAKELNVKKMIISQGKEMEVVYDTKLTEELKLEGEAREALRTIQGERKKLGIKQNEKINLVIPARLAGFQDMILKKVLVNKISLGDKIEVKL